MEEKPIAAGRSSFDLIDREKFLSELTPLLGPALLDLACGSGNYALALARQFPRTLVHAVDLWTEGIESLRSSAAAHGFGNIDARVADISTQIPLTDGSVDLCLAATVLHDLVEDGTEQGALREVRRVMKPGGMLAAVEFKKIPGPPGPPVGIRLSPEELEQLVAPFGFAPERTVELGPYTYLSLFRSGR